MSNPFLGVIFHWLGGLAAGSFYVPYRGVKRWSWETYWLVGGFFSWIIAPWLIAYFMTNNLLEVLQQATILELFWPYFWGMMWGLGGLTFGLTMRYLGMSLGMAVALGYCAVFGTLIPPIFNKEFVSKLLTPTSGLWILAGVVVCVIGIAVTGMAGMSKEREMPEEKKKALIKEFNFKKGLLVATFSGILSASMSFALNAGDPIKEFTLTQFMTSAASADGIQIAEPSEEWLKKPPEKSFDNPDLQKVYNEAENPTYKWVILSIADADGDPLIYLNKHGLWQGLPVLVVVLLGGFTTNFLWCFMLNIKNGTGYQYFTSTVRDHDEPDREHETIIETAIDAPSEEMVEHIPRPKPLPAHVPMLANYFFCALAGITWYFQFFFYSMGETQMGKYKFSSWTLHMASIIIFSTLWGIALREWKGSSRRTILLVTLGLAVLIGSTIIVGYGNYLETLTPAK